ncbi:MAG: NADH-quinone oxidoreductase subunit N [Candidatus Dormibacteria bacterium]
MHINIGYFIPELITLGFAAVALVSGLLVERDGPVSAGAPARTAALLIGLVGSALALVSLLMFPGRHVTVDVLAGTFITDNYAIFFKAILLVFAFVTVLLAHRSGERFHPHQSEFVALVLLATAGGMFMASAREMIELYVALETLSIALYVMVAFNKKDRLSSEAAFKYLVVGAASSAILLYGLAILYGLTGRTDLYAVAHQLAAQGAPSPALIVAMIFVIGGFSFKIAAVPFHQWVPDVYQGAPTPVTAFVSVTSKAAGYALLVRVLTSALLPVANRWGVYLAIIAAITMTVGNVTALSQTSLKRLLGYSSIAHAGYLVMGIVAVSRGGQVAELGLGALLFYLLVYGLTNLAAFSAVQAVEDNLGTDDISALGGLGHSSSRLALGLSICLLSLTGIPPLVGFFAKFLLFLAAVQAGYSWLAVVALANSALSSVYYLRVVRAMYLDDAREGARPLVVTNSLWAVMGIGMLAIVVLPVFSSGFVDLARKGAAALLH